MKFRNRKEQKYWFKIAETGVMYADADTHVSAIATQAVDIADRIIIAMREREKNTLQGTDPVHNE